MFLIALCQNYPNSYTPSIKIFNRALGKKYLKMTSPELLVEIQNNFTEMFSITLSARGT